MDVHLHSRYSLDSIMDMETAVLKCIELGHTIIAFTEHVDIDFPGYGDKFDVDFESYFKEIDRLQVKYPQIHILKGVEAGVTADTLCEVRKHIERYCFDYIVLSDHIIYGEDPYSDPSIYLKYEKKMIYADYLKDVYSLMVGYKDFDTLGHYDYITRYSVYEDPNLMYEDFQDLFDAILDFLAKNNKALELNTRTYDEHTYGKRIFDPMILKRFKELGGKYICLGSDSHNKEFIGFKFDYFSRLIKEAGFEGITYFKKRRPYIMKL
jgi:histidinol-phosphatase (PHP family)